MLQDPVTAFLSDEGPAATLVEQQLDSLQRKVAATDLDVLVREELARLEAEDGDDAPFPRSEVTVAAVAAQGMPPPPPPPQPFAASSAVLAADNPFL